jgi:hypothetical protein
MIKLRVYGLWFRVFKHACTFHTHRAKGVSMIKLRVYGLGFRV